MTTDAQCADTGPGAGPATGAPGGAGGGPDRAAARRPGMRCGARCWRRRCASGCWRRWAARRAGGWRPTRARPRWPRPATGSGRSRARRRCRRAGPQPQQLQQQERSRVGGGEVGRHLAAVTGCACLFVPALATSRAAQGPIACAQRKAAKAPGRRDAAQAAGDHGCALWHDSGAQSFRRRRCTSAAAGSVNLVQEQSASGHCDG